MRAEVCRIGTTTDSSARAPCEGFTLYLTQTSVARDLPGYHFVCHNIASHCPCTAAAATAAAAAAITTAGTVTCGLSVNTTATLVLLLLMLLPMVRPPVVRTPPLESATSTPAVL